MIDYDSAGMAGKKIWVGRALELFGHIDRKGLVEVSGEPTPYALQALQLGEPIPSTAAEVQVIVDKAFKRQRDLAANEEAERRLQESRNNESVYP